MFGRKWWYNSNYSWDMSMLYQSYHKLVSETWSTRRTFEAEVGTKRLLPPLAWTLPLDALNTWWSREGSLCWVRLSLPSKSGRCGSYNLQLPSPLPVAASSSMSCPVTSYSQAKCWSLEWWWLCWWCWSGSWLTVYDWAWRLSFFGNEGGRE